jgi:hypothetical protein
MDKKEAACPSSTYTHDHHPVHLAYQRAVFFSPNKPAISNQPTVLFSRNNPAPAISNQPNEQAIHCTMRILFTCMYTIPNHKS